VTNLAAISTFTAEGSIRVVIESPRGSAVKLKYDPDLQAITLSRPLTLGLTYPYDWGFVPSTRGPDGDPIDAIVIWDVSSYPGVVLQCRPVGVLLVEQTDPSSHARERNDRLVMLPTKAPRAESIPSVFDLGERVRLELERFFMTSVAFEGKDLKILGWAGPDDAIALVRASSEDRQFADSPSR